MRPGTGSKTTMHTNGSRRQPAAAGRRPLPKPCPYLGIVDDPSTAFAFATPANACFCKRAGVKKPYSTVELAHQESYCLTTAHTACPVFQQAQPGGLPATAASDESQRVAPVSAAGDASVAQFIRTSWRRPILISLLFVLIAIALLAFGRDLLPLRGATLNGEEGDIPPALLTADDQNTPRAVVAAPDQETATPETPITSGASSPKANAGGGSFPVATPSPTLPAATTTPTRQPSATSSSSSTAPPTAATTAVSTESATETPTVTPAPTLEATPCGPPAGWVTYIVQPGENLFRISLRHNSNVSLMMRANCLSSSYVYAGQRLFVPFHAPTATPLPEATATDAPPPTDEPPPPPTDEPPPPPTDTPPPPTDTPAPTPTAPILQTPTATLQSVPDPTTVTPAPTESP